MARRRCAVVQDNFYNKVEKLSVHVRMDVTGKLSKHIDAPDLGPKLPS